MEANDLLAFWWVLPIVASIVLYKIVLRFFFGMVIVPENKMGLVTKKICLDRAAPGIARWPHHRDPWRGWFSSTDPCTGHLFLEMDVAV
jgi:hypothetical protein